MSARLGIAQMERERVGPLGDLDHDGIVGSLVCVVLGQFDSQSSSLHAYRRVALGIKSRGATQDFGGNLVLLESNARVIERVFSQITEQFAKRLRGVEAMAFNKFIYLLEALLPTDCEGVSDSHITGA